MLRSTRSHHQQWWWFTLLYRMKDISDIKQHELESASNDFIRYKTLSEANDEIMNKVEKLPIFE